MNNKTDFSDSSSFKKIIQVQTFTFQFHGNAKLIFYSIKNKFSKSDKNPVFWLNCCVHVPQVKIKTCFLTLPNTIEASQIHFNSPILIHLEHKPIITGMQWSTFILNVMNKTSPQENKWLPSKYYVQNIWIVHSKQYINILKLKLLLKKLKSIWNKYLLL